jgi:hypothetical protein
MLVSSRTRRRLALLGTVTATAAMVTGCNNRIGEIAAPPAGAAPVSPSASTSASASVGPPLSTDPPATAEPTPSAEPSTSTSNTSSSPSAEPSASSTAPKSSSPSQRRAEGEVIEQATGPEDVDIELHEDGGPECKSVDRVTSPVRVGPSAYRSIVRNCGERAEMGFERVDNDGEYTYAWSLLVTEDAVDNGNDVLVNQWAYWPAREGVNFRRDHCNGVGHHMTVSEDGLVFSLAVPGGGCERIPLASLEEVRAGWIDVVMHVRWSRDDDGFIDFYLSNGDGDYRKVGEHRGPTTDDWNRRGDGPYFKMGAYTGEQDRGDWEVVTDEYRLATGDSFDLVRVGS